jgi:hypothetical protein
VTCCPLTVTSGTTHLFSNEEVDIGEVLNVIRLTSGEHRNSDLLDVFKKLNSCFYQHIISTGGYIVIFA